MADTGKIITIGEAKALLPSSFPDASGDELNRCPKKSELIANGFSITGTSRTYEDNQAVVATDIGGYDIKYTFSDAKVVFSTTYPANLINAAGTNYAKITATVTKKIGSSVIWSSGCTFTANKRSGDSALSVSANTYIKGTNRGTTGGAERSAVFYGTYQPETVYSTLTTGDFTVTQQENRATTSALTQWFSAATQQISSDGLTGCIIAARNYNYWDKYTSGSVLPATGSYNSTIGTSANTYSVPSSASSWISVIQNENPPRIKVLQNSTSNNRSAEITIGYKGSDDPVAVTSTTTINQWKAPYDTYEYRISSYGVSPEYLTSAQTGTNNLLTITASCQYRATHWKDGQTTYGSWSAFTDSNMSHAMLIGSTSHWSLYDGSASGTAMNLNIDSNGLGKIYAYATSANTGQGDIRQEVRIYVGNAQQSVTLIQKGYGNVSITISPTSSTFPASGGTRTFTVTSNVTGWNVSDSEGWLSTSINGNTVTVSATPYTNTATTRSGTVSVNLSGTTYATYTATQSAYVPPDIPGINTLFRLDGGWIVGNFISSHNTSPCNWDTKVIVLARTDAGVDTTFNFDSSGDNGYDQIMCSSYSRNNWPATTRTYTAGTKLTGTVAPDQTQFDCYGIQIIGGPGVTTGSYYAGISIV